MSGVPYVFANATTSIPLSQLDTNFATPVTIGNTTVALGNTVTSLSNVTITFTTWTTGTRPGSPAQGEVGFNTTTNQLEVYNGSAWTATGGGATGGGSDQIFVENGKTVTTNYTIPANIGASSVGPISVGSNVTVTVSTGSRWVVL